MARFEFKTAVGDRDLILANTDSVSISPAKNAEGEVGLYFRPESFPLYHFTSQFVTVDALKDHYRKSKAPMPSEVKEALAELENADPKKLDVAIAEFEPKAEIKVAFQQLKLEGTPQPSTHRHPEVVMSGNEIGVRYSSKHYGKQFFNYAFYPQVKLMADYERALIDTLEPNEQFESLLERLEVAEKSSNHSEAERLGVVAMLHSAIGLIKDAAQSNFVGVRRMDPETGLDLPGQPAVAGAPAPWPPVDAPWRKGAAPL